jgi:hypothetical protein
MDARAGERAAARQQLLERHAAARAQRLQAELEEAKAALEANQGERSRAARLREKMQAKLRHEREAGEQALAAAEARAHMASLMGRRHTLLVAFTPWRRLVCARRNRAEAQRRRHLLSLAWGGWRLWMDHCGRVARTVHVARCVALTRAVRHEVLRLCFRRMRAAAVATRDAGTAQLQRFVLRRWHRALVRRQAAHATQRAAWEVAQAPVVERLRWVFPLRACLRRWARITTDRADARRRQALRARLLAAAQGAL